MEPVKTASGTAPRWGFWTAATIGVLGLATVYFNPVVGLLHATLFLVVAWGIGRGLPWAALTGAALIVLPVTAVAWRLASVGAPEPGMMPSLVVSALVALVCVCLLLAAAFALFRRREEARAPAWPWAVLIVLIAAGWFLLQPMVIPTAAMANTLLAGDYVVVESVGAKIGRAPQPGELVVFRYPVERRNTFVKRVVGVPGDRLRIRDKRLYRNGVAVEEPYAIHLTEYTDSYRDNFPSQPNIQLYAQGDEMLKQCVRDGEVVVPEGKYFVLGDNRDNSLDSRYWGFISKSDILGRPVLIYGSYDVGPSLSDSDKTLTIRNLRWNRLLKRL